MKLYVIQSGKNCKIGISASFEQRLTAYSTHNPDYVVVETFECSNEVARQVELAVKRALAHQRSGTGQEWFAVPPTQMVSVVRAELHRYQARSIPPAYHGVPLPESVFELLEQIKLEYDNPKGDWERIRKWQSSVQREFAKAFDLGTPKDDLPESEVWKISAGVDHLHAQPGCNRRVNANNRLVHFPGMRYMREFFELLPLGSGRYAGRCASIAAMPYLEDGSISELEEALAYAQDIGWSCTLHHEWSWYHPGKTGLVLFQRTQSSLVLKAEWENSFQRWLIEHKKRLQLLPWGPADLREDLLDHLATEQHLPQSLCDFADFKDRFWDVFVGPTFRTGTGETLAAIERLFEMWHEQAAAPATLRQ